MNFVDPDFIDPDEAPKGASSSPEKKKAGWGTALHLLNEQAANTLDKGISLPAGALASLFDEEEGNRIFREMEERTKGRLKAANPNNEELSFGQKVGGTVATLPVQLLAMPFSPADTGTTMIDNGESLPRAVAGTGIDTVGNVVGVALPGSKAGSLGTRMLSGAGINAAQDAATRAAITGIAEKDSTKEIFKPTLEDAAVAGVVGAGVGVHRALVEKTSSKAFVDPDTSPVQKEGSWMERQLEEGRAQEAREQAFADQNNIQGELDLRPAQHAVDENGIPVDMARSLDAQEAGMGRQGDMFGDAPMMEPRQRAEAQMGREALMKQELEAAPKPDYSADIERAHQERQQQLFQEEVRNKQDTQAETLDRLEEELRSRGPRRGMGRRQGGALDLAEISEGLEKIKQKFQKFAVEVVPGAINPDSVMVRLQTPDGKLAGFVDFAKREDGTLVAENAQVADGLRGHGAAQRMYLAAREAGYDIAPGRVQTDLGNKMVERLQKNGLINKAAEGQRFSAGNLNLKPLEGESLPGYGMNRGMGGRQRGAIDTKALEDAVKAAADKLTRLRESGMFKNLKFMEKMNLELPMVRAHTAALEKLNEAREANRAEQRAAELKPFQDLTKDLSNLKAEERRSQFQVIKSPGGKQGGALDFEGITEGLRKLMPQAKLDVPAISNIIGKNAIPTDPLPKDVVSAALKEGRDTNAWNTTKYSASGGTLEGMSRKSALVEGVSRIVQNAQKRADLYIQKTVFPVEQLFRKMNFPEIQKLGEAFKDEMFSGKRLTAEELQAKGLNEKQLRAYAGMRKLFENTLEIQNQARTAQGLEPIKAKEHYMASRWQGDFRQPVYNKEGKLVWYLADSTTHGLKNQIRELLDSNPGLVVDPKKQHRVRVGGNKTDLQAMYTTMLDILGRDDPAVQKLKDAYETSVAAETGNTLGQQKHFERKGNIRGFVGDRPGTNAKREALAMFQEQVQYAKNAYKWASLQEAGAKIKEILSDENLQAQQPKNVEYAQEYFKNNLGHGEAKWVAALEDAFRELGVSPSVVDKAIGTTKSLFITQKLAVSAGYTMANLLQIVNTIPHLVDTMAKHGGNPVKAIGTGLASGTAMASGHYMNKLGGDFGAMTKDLPFLQEAFKYAEDNGVTSRSIYDEAPIDQRGIIPSVARGLGKTMTVPETWVRSVAYMTFVHMLKDTKAFKDNHSALFQKAEELTNASMVDYRAGERPMVFSKLGVAGNALNTLQTFPANLYNQYRYFGKEARKGNWGPLAAMIAVQYAMAGAMGIPGFQDFDKFITWGKGHVPDSVYKEVKDFDPKLWMIEKLGEASVYGVLSTKSGISMTSRLSAPGGMDMIQAPGGPIADLAKQAGTLAEMATNPTSTTVAQGVRNSAPTGLQGLMETKVFRDQNAIDRPDGTTLYKKATYLEDRQGKYARTPEEENLRKWGLRSQREALAGDIDYKVNAIEKQTDERSKSLTQKYYDAIRRGDDKKATDLQKLYVGLNGHEIRDESIEANMMEEYTTALERKTITAGEKLQAIKGLARLKKIMEKHDAN